MLKKILASLALASTLLLSGCFGSDVVPDGSIGFYVKNPYFGGESGNELISYPPGRHFSWATSEFHLVNIRPIQQVEVFDDFSTKNKTPVDFKAFIRYEIIPDKAPLLMQKYGENFYELNLQVEFQNKLRDFARRHDVTELTTEQSVTDDGETQIFNEMRSLVADKEMDIRILSVTIGAIKPPEEVLAETARTEAQTQRGSTENARAVAEEARAKAENKKALADKAYMNEMKMSPAEFLQSRQLELNREIVDAIKNKENVNILFTMGGDRPTVSVPQKIGN